MFEYFRNRKALKERQRRIDAERRQEVLENYLAGTGNYFSYGDEIHSSDGDSHFHD